VAGAIGDTVSHRWMVAQCLGPCLWHVVRQAAVQDFCRRP
jgi:hypothetical protein